MAEQQIIVTGAAGFIGRNVVAELNRRGHHRLLLVDHLGTDDKWRNLLGLTFDDLISPDELLKGVEADSLRATSVVIHLGACSSTTEKDADFLLRNNYRYTRTLCSWCLTHGSRFVYASSAATYGDGSLGYSDDENQLESLRPLNMYGYSKHLFDLWAKSHGLLDRIVGLKYFNVYGPYEDHKGSMLSVPFRAYHQIQSSGEVQLFKSYHPGYADGEQKRDFVYVNDAVDVTLHFAEHKDVGGLFNCGTGQARTWNDLTKATFAALGKPAKIRYIDMPESMRDKYQYFTQADVRKLRQIGYSRPFTSLEDGIRDYVVNYLMSNPLH